MCLHHVKCGFAVLSSFNDVELLPENLCIWNHQEGIVVGKKASRGFFYTARTSIWTVLINCEQRALLSLSFVNLLSIFFNITFFFLSFKLERNSITFLFRRLVVHQKWAWLFFRKNFPRAIAIVTACTAIWARWRRLAIAYIIFIWIAKVILTSTTLLTVIERQYVMPIQLNLLLSLYHLSFIDNAICL